MSTWKEFAYNSKDLTATFVSAMDLEDLKLRNQLFLLDLRNLSAHRFYLYLTLASLIKSVELKEEERNNKCDE